jgi:RecJ-like exonuclease
MYKKDFPELKIGDEVEVTGEISELYGETRIKVKERSDIKKLDYVEELKPISVEIAEIGENNEGSLIKISGEVTEIKSSYLYIDDGTEEIQVYLKLVPILATEFSNW